ncbi:MAG TPA: hypothetical protein VKS60_12420 [Stellaceae bacterium]|nr:hypothetical protein [Stellaceae bacterium]
MAMLNAWRGGLLSLHERSIMQFFVLVGAQRFGTTVFRETLATNPAISVRGEVFNPVDGEDEFGRYTREQNFGRPLNYLDAERQLRSYLGHLRDDLGPGVKVFGIDVKYGQLRSIAPYHEALCAVPTLVQFIRKSGCRVLHVVRDNVLHASLSEAIATARHVWHHKTNTALPTKFTIDCQQLIRSMQEKRADRAIFASLMEGQARMITCEYERTVRGLGMTDADGLLTGDGNPLFEVADFLGVPREFRRPGTLHKVVQTPYHEIIANYDQVRKTVGRTEFATLLDTI